MLICALACHALKKLSGAPQRLVLIVVVLNLTETCESFLSRNRKASNQLRGRRNRLTRCLCQCGDRWCTGFRDETIFWLRQERSRRSRGFEYLSWNINHESWGLWRRWNLLSLHVWTWFDGVPSSQCRGHEAKWRDRGQGLCFGSMWCKTLIIILGAAFRLNEGRLLHSLLVYYCRDVCHEEYADANSMTGFLRKALKCTWAIFLLPVSPTKKYDGVPSWKYIS